jgi:MFS family permease
MGYIGSTVSIGSIAGPMLGGYLVDFFGWQYIFFINIPIGIVLLALAARHMRIEETRSDRIQMDWIGAASMILFVTSLMMFLDTLTSGLGFTTIAIALVCLASLLAFVVNESRHLTPLLDLSVFREKKFVLPIISINLLIISSFALFILGPFYFQGVMGYTPSMVGTVFLIVPAIMTFGSPLGGWIYDKYHYKYNSAIGMLIVAASLTLAGYGTRRLDLPAILLSFVLMGVGSALVQSPMNTEIMNALPRNLLGTASSFSSAVRYLGMAMGVSVSSTLLSVQLRMEGYQGSVLNASPDLLSSAISNVMIIAAVLCVLGIITAALRNVEASDDKMV